MSKVTITPETDLSLDALIDLLAQNPLAMQQVARWEVASAADTFERIVKIQEDVNLNGFTHAQIQQALIAMAGSRTLADGTEVFKASAVKESLGHTAQTVGLTPQQAYAVGRGLQAGLKPTMENLVHNQEIMESSTPAEILEIAKNRVAANKPSAVATAEKQFEAALKVLGRENILARLGF